MMGRQHALSGVLFATGAAYTMNADVPTFVLLCTTLPGTALMSDIDHPDSTVSNTYGPITRTFARVLTHRKQTHSVPCTVAFGTAVYLAAEYAGSTPYSVGWWTARAVLFAVLVLIYASTIRLFKISGWLDDFAPIPFAAMITFGEPMIVTAGFSPFPFDDLPLIIVLGIAVHILGDLLTKQPIPILWPLSGRKSALGLFKAGGSFEKWIMTPAMVVGSAVFLAQWIMART